MSNTLPDKKSSKQDQPDIQFTTGNIGRWASQQDDPFAAQNRKRAAKKQERNRKRQKVAPIVVIIFGAILSVAAIVGLVFLIIHLVQRASFDAPEIAGGTTQDIADYTELLNDFYNRNPDATEEEKMQAVQDAVNGTLGTANGQNNRIAVKLAEASLYFNNKAYEEVISAIEDLPTDNMDIDQKILYYSLLYSSYTAMGNTEKSNEYSAKLSDAIGEIRGWEE